MFLSAYHFSYILLKLGYKKVQIETSWYFIFVTEKKRENALRVYISSSRENHMSVKNFGHGVYEIYDRKVLKEWLEFHSPKLKTSYEIMLKISLLECWKLHFDAHSGDKIPHNMMSLKGSLPFKSRRMVWVIWNVRFRHIW